MGEIRDSHIGTPRFPAELTTEYLPTGEYHPQVFFEQGDKFEKEDYVSSVAVLVNERPCVVTKRRTHSGAPFLKPPFLGI